MAVNLSDLLPGFTADEAKALLLATLQGIGPVQQIGSGAGVLVVQGSPLDQYDAIVQIQNSGAPGTATFSYSLDGGNTFTGPATVPANGAYAISGSGLTLLFSGVFASGDEYLFQTIFPAFPVSDWESGGIGRTFVEADSATLADMAGNALGDIAAGGFVDYASDANAPNSWLALLSQQLYNNIQFEPVYAVGLVKITLAAGASTVTFNPGDLIFANTVGSVGQLLYTNVNAGSITAGTSQSIQVQAVQPGAGYNVNNGVLTVLVTPKPGLSCNNPAPGVSAITPSGGATGTLAFLAGSNPNANYTLSLVVSSTGAAGTGKIQYSLDGGANYNAPQTIPSFGVLSLVTLGGQSTGLILTFVGTFTAGDTYSGTAFNSWLTTAGQNLESTQALQTRDKGKWATLGVGGGTSSSYDNLARTTPSGGSEVVKTFWQADVTTPGQVDGVVSGAVGPVSAAALTAITAYIKARIPLGTKLSLSNATPHVITVTGVVYVQAAQLAAAQAAIEAAITAYIESVPLGPSTVYANEIIAAVENQGNSGVVNYTQSAPSPNTSIALALGEIASVGSFAGITFVLV